MLITIRVTPSSTSILKVLGTRLLVFGTEKALAVDRQPHAELAHLCLQPRNRLVIHVGLRSEFSHIRCE